MKHGNHKWEKSETDYGSSKLNFSEPLRSSQLWHCAECKTWLFYYPYNRTYEWSIRSYNWKFGTPPLTCEEVKNISKMNESLE